MEPNIEEIIAKDPIIINLELQISQLQDRIAELEKENDELQFMIDELNSRD